MIGVWTTCVGNSAAFLPIHEFTNRTDEPSIVAGVKEQVKVVVRAIKAGKIAFAEYAGGGSPSLPLALQKPFSRGSVLINSTDPFADPVVDFGVYRNPIDVEIVAEIFKSWRKLLTMPSWAALGATETFPGANVTAHDDIIAYVKAASTPTIAHPCCTAPMMPKQFGGVIGSDLRVYGVNGLSIVDASIWPIIPSTHPVSTVYV